MTPALWALARPKGMLLVALLPVIGFSFAHWDHGCTRTPLEGFGTCALLALLWAVPHAGTMWLNAALDRDRGEVLFGGPVPVEVDARALTLLGYSTLLASVLAGAAIHGLPGLCVLGCAILSMLYSHPRTAWKGHPILGPVANVLGYGVLSPLGGFLVAGLPPTPRGALVLATGALFILAAYLAAQAFQGREDRARGYRTAVVLFGSHATLRMVRAFTCLALGAVLFGAFAGWYPRAVLVSLPAFLVADAHLRRWMKEPEGGTERWARGYFHRLAIAGLLCLGAVSAHYAWQDISGGALGGLGTAAGHPAVRVCSRDRR